MKVTTIKKKVAEGLRASVYLSVYKYVAVDNNGAYWIFQDLPVIVGEVWISRTGITRKIDELQCNVDNWQVCCWSIKDLLEETKEQPIMKISLDKQYRTVGGNSVQLAGFVEINGEQRVVGIIDFPSWLLRSASWSISGKFLDYENESYGLVEYNPSQEILEEFLKEFKEDDKVWVNDAIHSQHDHWKKRYFAKINKDSFECFYHGSTSWSNDQSGFTSWRYIAKTDPTIPGTVIYKFVDGKIEKEIVK